MGSIQTYLSSSYQTNTTKLSDSSSSSSSVIKDFISRQFKKIAALFASDQNKKLTDRKLSVYPVIHIQTKTRTFDQKCNYVIQDGKVYFRPLAAKLYAPWKEIPFPQKATAISADGDNLMVLAEDKRIYYAKTNSIEFCITGTGWEVTSFNLQWKKDWFNLDFVAPIVNFFKPAEIYAMEGARSVAISHKRQDAQDYTLFLKRHREPAAGITTLYMLDPTGTRILFADPWLPNKFHNEITGPEEGRFVAESMDASASTLFLIQRAKDRKGREIHQMYTRFADFSSIGSASLPIKNRTPDASGHPFEDWREQPMIPLKGQAHLTKHVTTLQTGKSRGERELRVEGTDQRGHTGYYHKGIYAHSWHFKRTDHAIPQKEFLPQKERGSGLRSGPAIAKDYTGWIKTQTGKFVLL